MHISFVRSVKMDSWTLEQINIMKAGGNEKCSRYLAEQGIPADASARTKYESAAAQQYKEILKATVAKGQGRTPSLELSAATQASCNNVTNAMETSQSSLQKAGDDNSDSSKVGPNSKPNLEQQRSVMNSAKTSASELFFPVLEFFFCTVVKPKQKFIPVLGMAFLGAGFLIRKLFPERSRAILFSSTAGATLMPFLFIAMVSQRLVKNRQDAFDSAKHLLMERIRTGRAERKDTYDLYLPPPQQNSTNQPQQPIPMGLIFYPGACVENTAYGPIAAKLSDEGLLVAVVNVEPLRLPSETAGGGKTDALKIMYDVLSSDSRNVTEWALGGHSMGAANAFLRAPEMSPGMSKLVLWGMSALLVPAPTLRDTAVDVLVVNASNDGFFQKRTEADKEFFEQNLPPPHYRGDKDTAAGSTSNNRLGSTVHVMIDGGNHAGFGHYVPQVFPTPDGERTITLNDQQHQCVMKTADFLLGRTEKPKVE